MDYFYTYTTRDSNKVGVDAMGTLVICEKLKRAGRAHKGSRQVVLNMYNK